MPDSRPLRPDDPEQLGDYRLIGLLGEGGQGVVYLGERLDDTESSDAGPADGKAASRSGSPSSCCGPT